MAKSKVGLGLALVVLMAPMGFLIGGLLSSFAVQQTGLAAVGVAFGYMVIGAVVAMVLGIVLAVYLPRERLKPMVGVAAVGALLIVAFIAFRIWQKQRGKQRKRSNCVRPSRQHCPMRPLFQRYCRCCSHTAFASLSDP